MKSDNPIRFFIPVFLVTLVLYLAVFYGLEYRRNKKGPWQVVFTTNATGKAELQISQPSVGLSHFTIDFANISPTNQTLPVTLLFTNPVRPFPYEVPFGKVLFIDSTFLPGTVTFELFGRKLELIPRVLIVDQREVQWEDGRVITLEGK